MLNLRHVCGLMGGGYRALHFRANSQLKQNNNVLTPFAWHKDTPPENSKKAMTFVNVALTTFGGLIYVQTKLSILIPIMDWNLVQNAFSRVSVSKC